MENHLLRRVELAFIDKSFSQDFTENDHQLIGSYTELLEAVCRGDYECALNNAVSHGILGLCKLDPNDTDCSTDDYFCTKAAEFLSADVKENLHLRQLVVLCIGISCLQLYVQNNYVGPETFTDHTHPSPLVSLNTSLKDYVHSRLAIDGATVYHLSVAPFYLYIANELLWSCRQLLTECQTIGLWQLRLIKTRQALLDERSATLKSNVLEVISQMPSNDLFDESVTSTESVRLQFHLEAGHLLYYYYEATLAKQHFETAKQLSYASIELKGVLGKRTRYQAKDVSQLVVEVKQLREQLSCDPANTLHCQAVDGKHLPKNIKLDDESVLNELQLKDSPDITVSTLSSLQQAVVLGMCYNHRRTRESEGQSEIVQEELMAHVNCVLAHPQNWCVQTMALLLRSRWEKDSARRLHRSLSQIEELVKNFNSTDVPGHDRLSLVYAVSLPPRWTVEQELGRLYDDIGAVSSALEIYLRLNCWEEVISCYSRLGHREKAEKLIREQLSIRESADLWCYLGDVTSDPQYYHQAWTFSDGKSARSQRALAYYHFNKRETGLWFTYGCACLECEEYSLAATAFHRCVGLDSDNFAAWSNLATAYIKSNNKPRAFHIYLEALKCDYENWRIWENFLAVATDVGEFEEAIEAYHRLLELRNKYTDAAVLTVLCRAVTENLADANGVPAARLRPKLLKLFGHVTAAVTNSSELWRLYGLLLLSDEPTDVTTIERIVQCLKASHSCATMTAGWEKDASKCREICGLSHQLASVYLRYLRLLTVNTDIERVKSSGRLMLKGVVTKIQKQMQDQTSDQFVEELQQAIKPLEEDLICVTNFVKEPESAAELDGEAMTSRQFAQRM